MRLPDVAVCNGLIGVCFKLIEHWLQVSRQVTSSVTDRAQMCLSMALSKYSDPVWLLFF